MTTNGNHKNYIPTRHAVLATPEEYELLRLLSPRARAIVLARYADPGVIPAKTVAERRHYVMRFDVTEAERELLRRLTPWQRTAYLLEIAANLDDLENYARERYGIESD
jgi:PHD/YefM family antitoxin component YafN of YafNO toxin-antitoxin module